MSRTEPRRELVCNRCNSKFVAFSRRPPSRCPPCQRKHKNSRSNIWKASKDPNKKIGVGSGGNQWGANNHQWKGGKDVWTKYKGRYRTRCLKKWSSVCAVPLCGVTKIEVHHVNGNAEDCNVTNTVPLCHDHHWTVHRNKRSDATQLRERLLELIPKKCRIEIAEKIGDTILINMAIRGEGQV